MRIVALAGGIGGARFLRGLLAAVDPQDEITVIGNTGDDIHLYGLKVCPDLDTVMYTLGGGIHEEQGWGRTDETWSIKAEMKEYGVGPEWFGLGDRDFATHLVRSQMLTAGYTLSQVTEALCVRWKPGVRLLPMSDDRVETHVRITDEQGTRAIHFQEYWVKLHAAVDAEAIIPIGAETAKPAPGVLEAIAAADVILFPPSNPVVSIGTILAVPGIREAVATAPAPVVGLSPIIGGAPVRGMADKVLAAVGVEATAEAVALDYGSRSALRSGSNEGGGGRRLGLLDGWLVDTADEGAVSTVEAAGIACRAVPLLMTDVDATAEMARAALALAERVRP
ncbi:2-phospho-L-lactate transferase [Streptomyces sp. SP17BM10]|uniref:2-phospho-L-lactate transferase n=1 Tax=Streptomyces sp. SP17BM10 TaxID=3002530 RepID=UPI002E788475|nr:2-phospho-L-lactate transferase [Streptomyces sp. SP17BM10]MEE1785626.1 2-phospho-L-lactate transferase [Streptomyces sp. SP17BM10]